MTLAWPISTNLEVKDIFCQNLGFQKCFKTLLFSGTPWARQPRLLRACQASGQWLSTRRQWQPPSPPLEAAETPAETLRTNCCLVRSSRQCLLFLLPLCHAHTHFSHSTHRRSKYRVQSSQVCRQWWTIHIVIQITIYWHSFLKDNFCFKKLIRKWQNSSKRHKHIFEYVAYSRKNSCVWDYWMPLFLKHMLHFPIF